MSQQEVPEELYVDEYTLGLVGPDQEWAGIVADGGTITTYTPPGCWGPMITPSFRGGHEVTRPIRVDGVDVETESGPIQVVGSGATVNDATQNAFDRASKLLDMTEGEIRARCTFTGGVQIGRLPGVVQLDMLVPMALLEERGLDGVVREQYGL